MENSVGGREGGDGMNCLVVPGVVSAAVGGGGKRKSGNSVDGRGTKERVSFAYEKRHSFQT